jgi:hypothetical protein
MPEYHPIGGADMLFGSSWEPVKPEKHHSQPPQVHMRLPNTVNTTASRNMCRLKVASPPQNVVSDRCQIEPTGSGRRCQRRGNAPGTLTRPLRTHLTQLAPSHSTHTRALWSPNILHPWSRLELWLVENALQCPFMAVLPPFQHPATDPWSRRVV